MVVTTRPARSVDLAPMADIYNEGIREGIATFETRERTAEDLRPWLDDAAHPVLVALDGSALVAWAAAGSYRPRACYAGVAEFSIYVARAARGRGVWRDVVIVERLLGPALADARAAGDLPDDAAP
jgi:phosphinothricin acetyltransferase